MSPRLAPRSAGSFINVRCARDAGVCRTCLLASATPTAEANTHLTGVVNVQVFDQRVVDVEEPQAVVPTDHLKAGQCEVLASDVQMQDGSALQVDSLTTE